MKRRQTSSPSLRSSGGGDNLPQIIRTRIIVAVVVVKTLMMLTINTNYLGSIKEERLHFVSFFPHWYSSVYEVYHYSLVNNNKKQLTLLVQDMVHQQTQPIHSYLNLRMYYSVITWTMIYSYH